MAGLDDFYAESKAALDSERRSKLAAERKKVARMEAHRDSLLTLQQTLAVELDRWAKAMQRAGRTDPDHTVTTFPKLMLRTLFKDDSVTKCYWLIAAGRYWAGDRGPQYEQHSVAADDDGQLVWCDYRGSGIGLDVGRPKPGSGERWRTPTEEQILRGLAEVLAKRNVRLNPGPARPNSDW